jgi:hypothetical protein
MPVGISERCLPHGRGDPPQSREESSNGEPRLTQRRLRERRRVD